MNLRSTLEGEDEPLFIKVAHDLCGGYPYSVLLDADKEPRIINSRAFIRDVHIFPTTAKEREELKKFKRTATNDSEAERRERRARHRSTYKKSP